MNAMDYLFYFFAGLAVLCALLVVANPFSRNPVTSALFLVLMMISLSGLYVTLHAFFLAAIQILVYAGAVMVLFLFVIMLLNIREEERRRIRLLGIVGGGIIAGSIALILGNLFIKIPKGAELPKVEGLTESLALKLFTQYTLPFEIVSLLLLSAMIGAIVLSKKEIK